MFTYRAQEHFHHLHFRAHSSRRFPSFRGWVMLQSVGSRVQKKMYARSMGIWILQCSTTTARTNNNGMNITKASVPDLKVASTGSQKASFFCDSASVFLDFVWVATARWTVNSWNSPKHKCTEVKNKKIQFLMKVEFIANLEFHW